MVQSDVPAFPRLLQPLLLKGRLLRNRIVVAPVSTRLAAPDGSVSPQMLAYYANVAAGGAAAVITETFHVDDIASKFTAVQPAAFHDRFLPGMSSLADGIKNSGALAVAQIGHAGRQSSFEANNRPPVAPSRLPSGPTADCRELSREQIAAVIRAFAHSARRAVTSGFDGVEIHAGNGYLLNQFLSPYTNRRSDEYGRRRELILLEVIAAVAAESGRGVILGLRLGCGDFVEGGLEEAEVLRIAGELPCDAIDYLHTSAGTKESNDYTIQPLYQPRALLQDVAKGLKKVTAIPVILTGSVNEAPLAEQLLVQGAADLIGMARPLLADPQLPLKVERGALKEIRPCIRCNQGCLGRVREGKTIRCSVNPRLGYEASFAVAVHPCRRPESKTVLVAGGGPAGITAALRAAELGFAVRLFEREQWLGGLLNTARSEPFKQDICLYLEHLLDRVARTDMDVVTGTAVDLDLVEKEAPEVLFDATGSFPVLPEIPSGLPYPVLPVRELLLDLEKYSSAKRVIVLGGGSSGCEAALCFRSAGARITVIEQAPSILLDLEPVGALSLLRLVAEAEVEVLTSTRFIRLDVEGVVTDRNGPPLPADLVIVALGGRSNEKLKRAVEGSKPRLGCRYLSLGDALKVGKIYEAVHDSYWQATSLLTKIV
jgi:2,4-dienoyl-CoA reductase-like NADH-dependent reductase (Old Yellow Enzyme family)